MTEKDPTLFERNMEMFEKFVNYNMDMMFKTMEKAMEGSQTFQEQTAKAVDKSLEGSQQAQEKIGDAVNRAIEGSQALQEQVNKAVSTAVSTQAEATLVALQALVGELVDQVCLGNDVARVAQQPIVEAVTRIIVGTYRCNLIDRLPGGRG